jgi:hypothetical protein
MASQQIREGLGTIEVISFIGFEHIGKKAKELERRERTRRISVGGSMEG